MRAFSWSLAACERTQGDSALNTLMSCAGIVYVVDAGRAKQKLLQPGAPVAQYDVRWISKASAAQRAGRAGRTGPGHCYRCQSGSSAH